MQQRTSLRRCSLQKQIATLTDVGVPCATITGCRTTPLVRSYPSYTPANMGGYSLPPHSKKKGHCSEIMFSTLHLWPRRLLRVFTANSSRSMVQVCAAHVYLLTHGNRKDLQIQTGHSGLPVTIWSHCTVLNIISTEWLSHAFTISPPNSSNLQFWNTRMVLLC